MPPYIPPEEMYTTQGEATGCNLWGRNGEDPLLDIDTIWELLEAPGAFFSACEIKLDDSIFGNPTLSYYQHWLFYALHTQQHVFVGSKPRQAMFSVGAGIGWLLRDCMYFGLNGYFYAHKSKTAEELHNQIVHAYENLDRSLRIPLKKGRLGTKGKLEFASGGAIQIDSAQGRSPGAGSSLDRLHLSELGEIDNQLELSVQLLPAYDRRPNARGLIETTPGRLGTWHRTQWDNSLTSMGQVLLPDGSTGSKYYPVFAEWWFGPNFSKDPPVSFEPNPDEQALLDRCKGMSESNLQWRRETLVSNGWSAHDFELKYPSTPYHGWSGTNNPTFPPELISSLLDSSISDVVVDYDRELGCSIIEKPVEKTKYFIFADSAGLDGGGDPSAFTIFDEDWTEVAFFESVVDAHKFTHMLVKIAAYYNQAVLVIENNHQACLGVLKQLMMEGMRINVYYNEQNKIGWNASGKSINEAEGHTLRALMDGDMRIRSSGTLHQLLAYSGVWRHRRVKGANGLTHHFDRARTVIMAGALLPEFTRKLNLRAKKRRDEAKVVVVPEPPVRKSILEPTKEELERFQRGPRKVTRTNCWQWQAGKR